MTGLLLLVIECQDSQSCEFILLPDLIRRDESEEKVLYTKNSEYCLCLQQHQYTL